MDAFDRIAREIDAALEEKNGEKFSALCRRRREMIHRLFTSSDLPADQVRVMGQKFIDQDREWLKKGRRALEDLKNELDDVGRSRCFSRQIGEAYGARSVAGRHLHGRV